MGAAADDADAGVPEADAGGAKASRKNCDALLAEVESVSGSSGSTNRPAYGLARSEWSSGSASSTKPGVAGAAVASGSAAETDDAGRSRAWMWMCAWSP